MKYLCITVRWLDDRYHGKDAHGEPEWPPSPLRLFQAMLAGACRRYGETGSFLASFRWLQSKLQAPFIVAPRSQQGRPYTRFVPNNDSDNKKCDRQAKLVRPTFLLDPFPIYYVWRLPEPLTNEARHYADELCEIARTVVAFGWGVDMTAACGLIVGDEHVNSLPGERWLPSTAMTGTRCRVPGPATLDALLDRHRLFVDRLRIDVYAQNADVLRNGCLTDVPPLDESAFRRISYARAQDQLARPYVVFGLTKDDGTRFSYPQDKLIHLAGMVRHLAIELMKQSPPPDIAEPEKWVETCVAGHRDPEAKEHRQFSYLPLPSIGHGHADPAVRRIMIVAPAGGGRQLNHLARLLAGQQLRPTSLTKLDHPPTLVRVHSDNVARFYTQPANAWASVTPVILPGHTDHKPDKTRRLIEAALRQSGVEQPCEFEWSPFSQFPKSLSAHKYDRDKRPTGYIRPDHLLNHTAVHLTLRFNDGLNVPGPLSIGSGRHCGLGLMAGIDS